MAVLSFRGFKGMIPRLPSPSLPQANASFALNAELAYADLRGVRQGALVHGGITVNSRPARTLYTEDGVDYFAWAYDADVVKSMVVGDAYSRIYYTIMFDDGPLIKFARLFRNPSGVIDGGGQTKVIGTGIVGGNFQPPEGSSQPDSWIVGVPQPTVNGDANVQANMGLVLADKPAWPNIPRLQIRATFFWEDLSGQIVKAIDVSNTELAPGTTNVFYTADSSKRGNLIQDMLWPLGSAQGFYGPRPYKYYWLQPPVPGDYALSRTVTITNNFTPVGNVVITYATSGAPPASGGSGSEGLNNLL